MAEVTPASVTVTYTMPAVRAGDVAVKEVGLLTVTPVAGVEPKFDHRPAGEARPGDGDRRAPGGGPRGRGEGANRERGFISELVGRGSGRGDAAHSNSSVDRAGRAGRGRGGWREVGLLTVTPVAGLEPKSTTTPLAKPVPVTVTDVPPAVGPVVGVRALTVGTAS